MTILLLSWDKEYEVSGCSPTGTTNLVAQREVPSLRITVQTEERSPVPERSTTTFPVLENAKEKPEISIMTGCEGRVVRALLANQKRFLL